MLSSKSLNIGSLLRLFKSDFFDSWMGTYWTQRYIEKTLINAITVGISYLFRYRQPGVYDYLCNRLYAVPDIDIEFYLVELINLMVANPVCRACNELSSLLMLVQVGSNSLERFIIDKCSKTMHLALLITWFVGAAAEDCDDLQRREKLWQLRDQCEMATVNCERPMSSGRS